MKTLYIAGPMTGYPQFNFPAFIAAAALLREAGWNIVSPAETDPDDVREAAMASPDGLYAEGGKVASETWGDMLARDVKQLADGIIYPGVESTGEGPHHVAIDGICFLPGWEKSKGARLEAFVGLLTKKEFYRYSPDEGGAVEVRPQFVTEALASTWAADLATSDTFREALLLHTPLSR